MIRRIHSDPGQSAADAEASTEGSALRFDLDLRDQLFRTGRAAVQAGADGLELGLQRCTKGRQNGDEND